MAIKIKINEKARPFNCHWYCGKVGEVFTADSYSEKLKCYLVYIDDEEHLVYEGHADRIKKNINNKQS